MLKTESLREHETHEILWDFEIKTDHLIPARRTDMVSMNNEKITCHLAHFTIQLDPIVKK